MRVECGRITLSRRNLLTLLHKLDVPDSRRTIFKDGIFVAAEEDSVHYGDVRPGRMSADTEAYIREHS